LALEFINHSERDFGSAGLHHDITCAADNIVKVIKKVVVCD
jgi:hypothetical protein